MNTKFGNLQNFVKYYWLLELKVCFMYSINFTKHKKKLNFGNVQCNAKIGLFELSSLKGTQHKQKLDSLNYKVMSLDVIGSNRLRPVPFTSTFAWNNFLLSSAHIRVTDTNANRVCDGIFVKRLLKNAKPHKISFRLRSSFWKYIGKDMGMKTSLRLFVVDQNCWVIKTR